MRLVIYGLLVTSWLAVADFSDDAGKCDHYVVRDPGPADDLKDLHTHLYSDSAHGFAHPTHVHYLFVCRVAVGYTFTWSESSSTAFDPASNRSLLANVKGVNPPVRPHTLIVNKGVSRYRYREIVSFDGSHVYPEYLIAYQRFLNGVLVGS